MPSALLALCYSTLNLGLVQGWWPLDDVDARCAGRETRLGTNHSPVCLGRLAYRRVLEWGHILLCCAVLLTHAAPPRMAFQKALQRGRGSVWGSNYSTGESASIVRIGAKRLPSPALALACPAKPLPLCSGPSTPTRQPYPSKCANVLYIHIHYRTYTKPMKLDSLGSPGEQGPALTGGVAVQCLRPSESEAAFCVCETEPCWSENVDDEAGWEPLRAGDGDFSFEGRGVR